MQPDKGEVKMLKNMLGSMCALAILAGLAPATASAQPADKRTIFTFSGPVDMPGVALPAGKYVFRLANPDTSRNVVQVTSADGKRVFGMFHSYPSERPTPANDSEIRFLEASAGAPPAVKTWWYPGERSGYEFIYPKQQARRIADRTRQAVLTTKSDTTTTEQTDTTDLTRVAPGGSETAANNAAADPAPASATAIQRGEITDNSRPTQVARARTELPRTASASPLIALIGILMLAAAAIVRFRTA
jgi:LPXTG-motif cell wall-anchored protein